MNNKFIEIYGCEEKLIISLEEIKSMHIYNFEREETGEPALRISIDFFNNHIDFSIRRESYYLPENAYSLIRDFFKNSNITFLTLYMDDYIDIKIAGDAVFKELEEQEAKENGS